MHSLVKSGIIEVRHEVFGVRRLEPMKPWITGGILHLIQERNMLRKAKVLVEYKRIQNRITTIYRGKRKYMDQRNYKRNT